MVPTTATWTRAWRKRLRSIDMVIAIVTTADPLQVCQRKLLPEIPSRLGTAARSIKITTQFDLAWKNTAHFGVSDAVG